MQPYKANPITLPSTLRLLLIQHKICYSITVNALVLDMK